MIKIVMAVGLALASVGCATNKNTSNYASYLDAVQKIESSKAVAKEASLMGREAQYASMLEKCTSDSCVSSVAAFKAIADTVESLAGGSGGRTPNVAAPQREPTFSEKALSWAGVLIPGATQYAGIVENNRTQRHTSDNAAAVSISQNETWANIIGSQGTAWSTALNTVAATPSISVGGNYGDTSSAGTSLTSGDGNTIGNGNGNSGRIGSDGPFDSSGDCRDGSNCTDNSGGG